MTKEYSKKIPRMISDVRISISAYLHKELIAAGLKGIVPSHGEILFNLTQNGDMTMTELSVAITKDRSTVTALVSKLEKRDMVKLIENPKDRRSKKVTLTKKSKRLENELVNISNNMLQKLWNNISNDEKDIFIKVLLKIHDNFNTMESS